MIIDSFKIIKTVYNSNSNNKTTLDSNQILINKSLKSKDKGLKEIKAVSDHQETHHLTKSNLNHK